MTSPGSDPVPQQKPLANGDEDFVSDNAHRPFRVTVSNDSARGPWEDAPDLDEETSDDLSMDDIEAAYLRALETADAATAALPDEFAPEEASATPVENADTPTTTSAATPDAPPRGVSHADGADDDDELTESDESSTTLRADQVIEGLLFVGGSGLTVKRMAEILGGSHTSEQIEDAVTGLNETYHAQSRPYEIALVEGGYRMRLKEPFESVRRKVYGQGPKEVKLGQDALEVLAVIAYRQPITRAELEETGKPGLPGLLRQLLRRQLIHLDRETTSGEGYRTTPRFLDLFGLTSLDALPQAADFNFR